MGGAKQTVVTDFNEAWREDVLQEAADELFRRQRASLNLISGRLLVGESDLAIFECAQPVVAEGDAKDVRGEVFASLLAGADRQTVNHPVFFPDARLDLSKQAGLFQRVPELGAKDHAERLFVDQKVFGCRAPAAGVSEAAAGDEVVDVGMKLELSGPGLEHAEHAEAATDEARVLGQQQ